MIVSRFEGQILTLSRFEGQLACGRRLAHVRRFDLVEINHQPNIIAGSAPAAVAAAVPEFIDPLRGPGDDADVFQPCHFGAYGLD
jgi:hypothetical protein